MTLEKDSTQFIAYIEKWLAERPVVSYSDLIKDPEKAAIISVDVINGFLYEGPLASPRVAVIDEAVTSLMQDAWHLGLRNILLIQEGHHPDSLEFEAFGEHAVLGTPQADAIAKIKALPFYQQMTTIYKDSIHPAINTGLEGWLNARPELQTLIAVGDVTDLCLYQLATYLKMRANAYHQKQLVVVPMNCVQTWHLSVEDAAGLPAMPHHGDLLNAIFLYHMAMNDILVVKAIDA